MLEWFRLSRKPVERSAAVSARWHDNAYFFTAEIAENAENGELPWALLSASPVVFLPFPCFLPFSVFSATSAVKSRVGG